MIKILQLTIFYCLYGQFFYYDIIHSDNKNIFFYLFEIDLSISL